MTDILKLLLVCATVSCAGLTVLTAPLKCRRCTGAASLEDCRESLPCTTGEMCYLDKVVNEQLAIEYYAGCRPRDVCTRAGMVGKRRRGYLIACSHCCDADGSPECNTRLCDIQNSTRSKTLCNHCVIRGSGGQGVTPHNPCAEVVACPSDQMCGAESYTLSSERTNLYECLPKQRCVTETVAALHRKDACSRDPAQCTATTPTAAAPGYTKCYACCGDDQCNWRTCEQTIDHLYVLWKAGVLDTMTLKQNGSLPSTTAASG